MKQFLGLIMLIVSISISYGQHTEFSLQAGSGLFSYGGPRAANETYLFADDVSGDITLGNPYGRGSGFSYGLTGQVQRITKKRFIYGIQTGYESLTSRVAIVGLIGERTPLAVDGQGTLSNRFITLNPFIGKRLISRRLFTVDLTAGIDLAVGLFAFEKSRFMWSSGSLTTNENRSIPDVDFRSWLNLTGYYRAFGISLGYSHGLTNYALHTGSNAEAYSRLWRVGMVYRLVKRA